MTNPSGEIILAVQLTAEEIYSINNNSLKNAIVQFNGSCTASIISPEGLVITNHHCGYGSIADLSTAQHNYLREWLFGKTKADELPPKRLFVLFLCYAWTMLPIVCSL